MFGKKHLIITAVCTAAVVWVLACVYFVGLGGYESGDALLRAKKIITDNYVNPLTEEQLTRLNDMAISAMVYSLEDHYSQYLNVEDMEAYTEDKQEQYKGIGIGVSFNYEENIMSVTAVYENSPAQKAGILFGDVITRIGGQNVSAETYNTLVDYIRKGENDEIQLTIQRDGGILELTVMREEIEQQSVSHKMFGGHIGYIRISEFIHNTTDEFAAALEDLKNRDMAGLVIDLRNNPGGYADTVLEITDSLLPEGVIAYLEDSHGDRQYFNSDKKSLDLPIAVLINGETASASELLAGSLQAHGLATIIGEKSYGKAVGQSLYPVTTRTALYLTNARYYTPKGECIDGVGIQPDVKISMSKELTERISVLEPEEDVQLACALEVLGQKTKK